MQYKVFIPTAGTGSRLGTVTTHLNKSLLTVAGKPILAHLVERIPQSVPVVVALGHGGDYVEQFLRIAYPERVFEFVRVTPYQGPGSGLGRTLLSAAPLLQCPFVFWSCDSLIVTGEIPTPQHDWMGYDQVAELAHYRTIGVKDGRVHRIYEKGAAPADALAYIGVAGIHDYATFWSAMRADPGAIEIGEVSGLAPLVGRNVTAYRFDWQDTGRPPELAKARAALPDAESRHILEKDGEAIWFVDGRVIKFSRDRDFIRNRTLRSQSLDGFVPRVTASTENCYSYQEAPGEVLARAVDTVVFAKLLRHLEDFWRPVPLDDAHAATFRRVCLEFYRDKTQQRIRQFFDQNGRPDRKETINGVAVPSLGNLLERVDWHVLQDGLAARFHGDLHFENILHEAGTGRFTLLDWRQDFGGELEYGDVYYDLAKINHGLIMSHAVVTAEGYEIEDVAEGEIRYDFFRRDRLIQCEAVFAEFLRRRGYDARRVEILTALVFLNIAPLHHQPYSRLLFYLGKSRLAQALET